MIIVRQRNWKSMNNKLNNLVEEVSDLRSRLANKTLTNDDRWNWVNGELKRIDKLVRTEDIHLSHVDATNVKVDMPARDVLQALADHLRLGVLPAQEDEIVVINSPDA